MAALALVASLGVAAQASAKTFVVTKRGDPAPNGCRKHDCSLREAIRAANSHVGFDEVTLPSRKGYGLARANTGGGEDAALEGDLDITGRLAIRHAGRGAARVDANGLDRVFDVQPGARTSFSKLVITGGNANTGDGYGGGIRAQAAIRVVKTKVRGNESDNDGGGIGLPDAHPVSLRRVLLARNDSGNDGGGLSVNSEGPARLVIARTRILDNSADDWGGGLITAIRARITRTTVARNDAEAGSGGGVTIEGPNRSSRIEQTTIAHNTSDAEGGGLAIDFTEGVVGVVNTTITANDSDSGGGGVWGVEVGVLKLSSVTVARNSASQGGGLFSQTPTFRIQNSIVGLNHATGTGNDCGDGGVIGQAFDSLGHNLLSDLDGCVGFDAPGDIVRADPGLGALGNHGGPTQTVSLLLGSPAIGHAKRGTSPKRDQRGVPRDRKPDAGAFER